MTDAVAITGAAGVREPALGALPEPIRQRAARAERVTQLLFAAAAPALDAAGLAVTDGEPRPRLGVVVGTGFGCFLTNAAYHRRLLDGGPPAASPRLFAATVSNAAAGELGIAYRLGGPAVTLTAGGVSGLAAIAHACDLLAADQADVLVVGGVDAAGDDLARWIAAGGLRAAAVDEGAAVVVLERLGHAQARGAAVHALVTATRIGFDPDAAAGDAVGAARGVFAVVEALERFESDEPIAIHDRCPTGHVASVELQRLA